MTFNPRRYDENLKRIILNERYLFSFLTHDGFSHRSLRVEFLVDYDYNMTVFLSCNKPSLNENNYEIFKESSEEKASPELIVLFESLLATNYKQLKNGYDYETLAISNIGAQQLLINFDSPTINVHILDGLPEIYFQTPAEKQLFLFNEYMKHLALTKYHNISQYLLTGHRS